MENIARTGRGGWKEPEIVSLRDAVHMAGGNGEPLRGVFERVGHSLGRRPNSVRNFYYACLKREDAQNVPHAASFETFTPDEVRALVREVLSARAQGVSVRACVQRMADGDRKAMLRYQNKYRSVLKSHPALVAQIMDEMSGAGEKVFDPYAVRTAQARPLYENIASTLQNSGDPSLLGFLRGLDVLLTRAGLSDHAPLKSACEPLLQCAKEFLGLPAQRRVDALGAFCAMLSEHVGTLENAMGA